MPCGLPLPTWSPRPHPVLGTDARACHAVGGPASAPPCRPWRAPSLLPWSRPTCATLAPSAPPSWWSPRCPTPPITWATCSARVGCQADAPWISGAQGGGRRALAGAAADARRGGRRASAWPSRPPACRASPPRCRHRGSGASKVHGHNVRENTLLSFQKAALNHSEFIEFDVSWGWGSRMRAPQSPCRLMNWHRAHQPLKLRVRNGRVHARLWHRPAQLAS